MNHLTKLGLALALALTLFAAGCGQKKTPLDEAHADYAGEWKSADGSWMHLWADGTGDLKAAGSTVNGAAARFEGDKLIIKMVGIGQEYTITEAPKKVDGKMVMKLDGKDFVRQD